MEGGTNNNYNEGGPRRLLLLLLKQFWPPVFASYNIFRYNALGNSDTIYGVEPFSYYVKNLLLNLNLCAPLGMLGVVVHGLSQRVSWDLWSCLFCLVPWLLITLPRPHKEERFLYPVYPLLVTGSAMVGDALLNAIGRVEAGLSRHKSLSNRQRLLLEAVLWLPVLLLGMSRTAALSRYYSAPFDVYTHLSLIVQQQDPQYSGSNGNHNGSNNVVCTCGEWYRFPSSFFLASEDSRPLRFLPSSFTGHLPQPFAVTGSRPSSQRELQPFRDDNGMNPERFVSLEECGWVVELEGGDCNVTMPGDLLPSSHSHKEDDGRGDNVVVVDTERDRHSALYRHPFLNAAQTNILHRVLYLPGWHEAAARQGKVSYQDYVLYKIPKQRSIQQQPS
jgi:alpha-1,2-mannosyltransferase